MGAPIKAAAREEWTWRGKRRASTWYGVLLDDRDSQVGCCRHCHRSYVDALDCAVRLLAARTHGRR
jgi:hypothetical protein